MSTRIGRFGRSQLTLAGVLAVLLAAPLLTAVAAGDVNGSGKFWPFHHTPVKVEFGDNLTNSWERYFRKALDQWNESDVVQGKSVRGATTPQQCKPKKDTVQVCNGRYGTQGGWLGLTTLSYNGDKITEATTQLNEDFFNQSQYDSKQAKQHTMCHELGHAFGLDHVSYKSCMNPSDNAVFHDVKPSHRDFKTLDKIYSKKNRSRKAETAAAGPTGTLVLPQAAPAAHETVTTHWQADGTLTVNYISWAPTAP